MSFSGHKNYFGKRGLTGFPMEVPPKFSKYNCIEYYKSPISEQGYWDESSQYLYFWPAAQVFEDVEKQFLVIGSAGVDGIDWGYRKGIDGLWAYYPIEQKFFLIATSFQELVEGWLSGKITV